MKRKIFSKLLMVAMLVASVSMFVSCKDYDDDINKLTNDVTGLQTQLSTLNSALQTAQQNIQTAQAAATAAQKAGDDAKAAAETAKAAAEAAKAAAIEDAKAQVEALAGQIADGYVTKEAFDEAVAKLATAEALDEAVSKLYSKEKGEELETKIADILTRLAAIDSKLIALGNKDTELEGLIGTNKAAIADNAVAIQQLKTQVKADSLALEAFKTLADQKYATKTAVAQAVGAALATANTRIDSLKTAINTALEAYAKKTDLEAYAKKVSVDSLKARMQAAELAIQGLAGLDSTQIKAIVAGLGAKVDTVSFNAVKAQLSAVANNADLMSLYISKQLTSLVFKPSFMFQGVEAEVLPALFRPYIYKISKNEGKIVFDEDGDGDYEKSEQFDYNEDLSEEEILALSKYQDASLYYHFNPSTADLEGYNVQFFNNEPRTRAAGINTNIAPLKSTISNEDKTSDGFLKIDVANNQEVFWNMWSIFNQGKYPMVALQALKGDTVVTSDYALVRPLWYHDLRIGDAVPVYGFTDYCRPIYDRETGMPDKAELTRYVLALADQDTRHAHPVMYNEAIDLKTLVNTHYTEKYDADTWGQNYNLAHNILPQEVLDEFGLSYKFEALDWDLGDETTSQSVHMHVEADGRAWPVEVNNQGEVIDATKVNEKKGAVGRMPIVRVTLEDADGNIYSYGYLKLVIVEEIVEPSVNEVAVAYNDVILANCNENSASVTWSEVEAEVLNKLDISHATFFDNYEPVINGYDDILEKSILQQYVKVDGKFQTVEKYNRDVISAVRTSFLNATPAPTAAQLTNKFYELGGIGYIKFQNINNYVLNSGWGIITYDWNYRDPRTNLFTWTLRRNDYAALTNSVLDFVNTTNGKSKKPLETYVRLQNGSQSIVYVKQTIPVEKIQFAAGTLGKRIAAKWYATGAETEGTAEIHANVPVPTTDPATGSIDKFVYNILTTFEEAKIGIAGIDDEKFAAFAEYLNSAKFFFDASKYDAVASVDKYVAPKATATGMTGTVYGLTVNSDATKLYAVKVETSGDDKGKINIASTSNMIASVSADDAKQEIVTLNLNDYTKDILNYVGHKDLVNTMVAYMKVKFDENVDVCYIPNVNGTDAFAIRFLRPINSDRTSDNQTAIDGVDKGSQIDLVKMLKLDDWRDYGITYVDAVASSKKQHDSYIGYYGISYIIDLKNIVTDENKDEAERVILTDSTAIKALGKVLTIDPQIKIYKGKTIAGDAITSETAPLEFTPVWYEKSGNVAAHWGAENDANFITYYNNQTTARKYHLYVPITVKYNYGYLPRVWGVIVVNGTVENSARNK